MAELFTFSLHINKSSNLISELNLTIMKRLTLLFLTLVSLGLLRAEAQTFGVPTGLNATPVYDFQATISWTAVSVAQFYNIRFRKVGTGTFTNTSSTPNSKILSGLTPGTQYE